MNKSNYTIIVLLILILAAIVIDIQYRVKYKPVLKTYEPVYYNYNSNTPKENKKGSKTIKIGRSHSGSYVTGSDKFGENIFNK
jgi:ABC-type dipeptide/oligopeptide/nickel transport system permease subunit